MKEIIVIIIVFILIGATYFVTQGYYNNKNLEVIEMPEVELSKAKIEYIDISVDELDQMLISKDFKLVDVHIPEQQHIPGTDKMIAYNEIDKFVSQFPNKDEKIVLYCRSGSMSYSLSKKLVDQGYTNIYNLEGGVNAWKAAGKSTSPIGSL